jgi:hypothetical protein
MLKITRKSKTKKPGIEDLEEEMADLQRSSEKEKADLMQQHRDENAKREESWEQKQKTLTDKAQSEKAELQKRLDEVLGGNTSPRSSSVPNTPDQVLSEVKEDDIYLGSAPPGSIVLAGEGRPHFRVVLLRSTVFTVLTFILLAMQCFYLKAEIFEEPPDGGFISRSRGVNDHKSTDRWFDINLCPSGGNKFTVTLRMGLSNGHTDTTWSDVIIKDTNKGDVEQVIFRPLPGQKLPGQDEYICFVTAPFHLWFPSRLFRTFTFNVIKPRYATFYTNVTSNGCESNHEPFETVVDAILRESIAPEVGIIYTVLREFRNITTSGLVAINVWDPVTLSRHHITSWNECECAATSLPNTRLISYFMSVGLPSSYIIPEH